MKDFGRPKLVHPYQWLWENLESDPRFLLRPMFGGKAAYLDGKLMLYFTAKQAPWRGVLVCTDRARHMTLLAEFPELEVHPILSKWLYLPELSEHFEKCAEKLVILAKRRDPRIGVEPKPRKRRTRLGIGKSTTKKRSSLGHRA